MIKKQLIEAHNLFMRVTVSGENLEPMYMGLATLTNVINNLPDDEQEKEEAPIEVSDSE